MDREKMKRQAKAAREWAAEARQVKNPSPRLRRMAAAKLRHAEWLEHQAARNLDEWEMGR